MERNKTKRSSFEVSEEQWLETLSKVSTEAGLGTLWVSLRSTIVTVLATPYQVQVCERTLYLRRAPESPSGSPPTEILVFLPRLGVGLYEKRVNEKGQVRLSMSYPAARVGDTPSPHDIVQLVVATSEEFLTVADSEVRVQ